MVISVQKLPKNSISRNIWNFTNFIGYLSNTERMISVKNIGLWKGGIAWRMFVYSELKWLLSTITDDI